jgi:hypothetical protein
MTLPADDRQAQALIAVFVQGLTIGLDQRP